MIEVRNVTKTFEGFKALDGLDLDREEEEPDSSNKPGRDLLEARFAARRIRELLDKPFLVAEGDALRPVRPSDIMVLLRSPGNVLHHYIRPNHESNPAYTDKA